MDTKHRVLFIIGLLLLIKAVWLLVYPESARKVSAWWLRTVKHVNTLVGIVYAAIGLALGILVLFQQPLANWILGILALLCIYAGLMTIRFADMERLLNRVVLQRRPFFIRVVGAVALLCAVLFVWVALQA